MISKRHCAVIQRDGKVFVRDFDSTNGTFVNDQPVKGEVELHHGDQLKAGPLLFSVALESIPVNTPTPAPVTSAAATVTGGAPTTKSAAKPKKQPAPPPPPADDEAGGSEDEDAAAMLLSMGDDTESGPLSSAEVPDGSTVMDVAAPALGAEAAKTDPKNDKAKNPNLGNTQNAAKAILEKYTRRPRNNQG
jgi:pSer/pThr/pTyr-binding forkhead associated (FHA) protein